MLYWDLMYMFHCKGRGRSKMIIIEGQVEQAILTVWQIGGSSDCIKSHFAFFAKFSFPYTITTSSPLNKLRFATNIHLHQNSSFLQVIYITKRLDLSISLNLCCEIHQSATLLFLCILPFSSLFSSIFDINF